MRQSKSSNTKKQSTSKAKTLKPRKRARILMHFLIYPDYSLKAVQSLEALRDRCDKGRATPLEVRDELTRIIEKMEAGMFGMYTDKGQKV